jgi:hypothetical protein
MRSISKRRGALVLLLVALVGPLALRAQTAAVITAIPGAISFANEGPARPLEVARLRAHFDSADAELRQAKTLHLSSSQLRSRAILIAWLREYRDAGEFPQNDRFPDRAMPFFRDSRGVLCAMAYLIDRSGRGDFVDRVASTRNNAFIAELASDPAFQVWLDSVGLSVAEAARIQPTYDPGPVENVVAYYDSVWIWRDTSNIKHLLVPEYQYFSSRGGVSSRAETLALLASPDYRLEDARRSEIAVWQTGPVAIVSSRWRGRGTYRGKRFNDDQRCGQTWILADPTSDQFRMSRRWQLVSEHCVQIAPAKPSS